MPTRFELIAVFFVLIIAASIRAGNAQTLTAQSLFIENPLLQNKAEDITIDADGFVWIATTGGLTRFDGHEFKAFQPPEKYGFQTQSLLMAKADKYQNIWIQAQYGVYYIFDIKKGRAYTYQDFFGEHLPEACKNLNVISLTENIASNQVPYLICNNGEVYRYDGDKKLSRIITLPTPVISMIDLTPSSYGTYWGKNEDGSFHEIDTAGTILQQYDFVVTFIGVADGGNFQVLNINDKSQFALSQLSKNGIEVENSHPLPYPELSINKNFTTYQHPKSNILWYSESRYSPDKNDVSRLFAFEIKEGKPKVVYVPELSFLKNRISRAGTSYADGTMVFCSSRETKMKKSKEGIMLLQPENHLFDNYLFNANYSTRSILEADNQTYAGTYAGSVIFEKRTGDFSDGHKPDFFKHTLYASAKDNKGNLWFTTEQKGGLLFSYHPVSKKEQQFQVGTQSSKNIDLNKYDLMYSILVEKSSQKVWVGTGNGLLYLDADSAQTAVFQQYNQYDTLASSTVYKLYENKEGIWVGSSTGLYLLDAEKGIIARYTWDRKKAEQVASEGIEKKISKIEDIEEQVIIKFIHEDDEGVFWLGTQHSGLIRWDKRDNTYQLFSKQNGLSHFRIHAIYSDDFNNLWMSSDYGLMCFDKQTNQTANYFLEDGISNEEFNFGSSYQASDGRLYFGGINGITSFYPQDLVQGHKIKQSPETLWLTECSTFGKTNAEPENQTREVIKNQKIILPAANIYLELKFSLLANNHLSEKEYAYKIEGFDDRWTSTQKNAIRINKLPAGDYAVRIRGRVRNGDWNENEINLPIIVEKAFYEKWWFYGICLVVVAIAIYFFIRRRENKLQEDKLKLEKEVSKRTIQISTDKKIIEKQANELKELDEMKSRFFTNISHELRTPLTLLTGHINNAINDKYGALNKKVKTHLLTSKKNGDQLLQLIEEILELSKLDAKADKLNESAVPLYPFVQKTCDQYKSFIDEKKLKFEMVFELDRGIVLWLDETKFHKILGNLLVNAIKYTHNEGAITLLINSPKTNEQDCPQLQVKVQDTGRGIPEKELPYVFDPYFQTNEPGFSVDGGTGIGLSLVRELVLLMGGEISVQSQVGEGSAFIFSVPLKTFEDKLENKQAEIYPSVLEEKIVLSDSPNGEEAKSQQVILLVEDHREMREFVRINLPSGYKVLEAEDGREALGILESQKVDLVVSDVMMPNMDGFELLKIMKSDDRYQHVSVIMLTARVSEKDRLKAMTIGVDDYLTKPFDPLELQSRIDYVMKNQTERTGWLKEEGLLQTKTTTFNSDQEFLKEIESVFLTQISSLQFSIPDLAGELEISQSQLFKKTKSISGLSPLQYFTEIRLQTARRMLEAKQVTSVSEAMLAVGIQKSDYFAKIYRNRFGKLPSDYLK